MFQFSLKIHLLLFRKSNNVVFINKFLKVIVKDKQEEEEEEEGLIEIQSFFSFYKQGNFWRKLKYLFKYLSQPHTLNFNLRVIY